MWGYSTKQVGITGGKLDSKKFRLRCWGKKNPYINIFSAFGRSVRLPKGSGEKIPLPESYQISLDKLVYCREQSCPAMRVDWMTREIFSTDSFCSSVILNFTRKCGRSTKTSLVAPAPTMEQVGCRLLLPLVACTWHPSSSSASFACWPRYTPQDKECQLLGFPYAHLTKK